MKAGDQWKRAGEGKRPSYRIKNRRSRADRSKAAGYRRRRAPVIFVGGTVIRALDDKVVIGDCPAIAERGQRIAVRIEKGKIKIARTGVIDTLLLVKPEFHLHEHGGFLLHRVLPVESDLQAVASRVSYRRFPHKLDRHEQPHCSYGFFHCTTSALKISESAFPNVSCHVRAFQNRHGRICPHFRCKGSKPYPRDVIPGDPPRFLNPVHRSVPMPSVAHERLHAGACEQEEKR